MPDFATPEPISAVIDLVMGDVRIAAGDRRNTVVEVRPRDPGRRDDATAADEARVEYDAGRLLIKTTRRWRSYSPFSDGGSVDVHVQLPTGSRVTGTGEMTAFRCTGSLGDCRLKTAFGDIQVDGAARVELSTSAGDISVGRATDHAEISTGTGALQIDALESSGVIKNSNGDSHVGEATGDLRVKAANGDIAIDRARASVVAKTANGDIRVGGVRRGSIVAETGLGAVEIAIADGTAAWLDLDTKYGHLHNTLDAAGPPGPGDDTVEVRGRTPYGDITIRRSDPPAPVDPTA